ncbi:MAG: acyl carrier protein [Candidatus Zixiibacteriota bacterium]|nr:MAG: acyl carrier protein [candidate division Zixibacteria bacterium]
MEGRQMAIEENVRQFIVENFMMGANPGKLRDEDSFLENGIIDSTGVLELVGFIEENFEVSVADEELVPENLDSISNVAAYITRKRALASEVA